MDVDMKKEVMELVMKYGQVKDIEEAARLEEEAFNPVEKSKEMEQLGLPGIDVGYKRPMSKAEKEETQNIELEEMLGKN